MLDVLHHMAGPEAGWHNLRRLLKPGGAMRIGLYSHIARSPIRQVRQMIEEFKLRPITKASGQYTVTLPRCLPTTRSEV